MSDIQPRLAELASGKITVAVLRALDTVVPGEWTNVTSLDDAIRQYLGVSDPNRLAQIRDRAVVLFASKPHYGRAIAIYDAVDTADRAVAAAVAANAVGSRIQALSVLEKFTPKPDTIQALDAALKLAAEVIAFATLRGLPVHSLAEAKAFPAALATYAKADLMRLAAWITIDGLLPLGPDFVKKIVELVGSVDTASLTGNPLFQKLGAMIPGGTPDAQKGFLTSTLSSGASYVSEFVSARGLTREGLAGAFRGVIDAADTGMDILAATLDATTNYYAHTGVQSVARVLVHDAQAELDAQGPVPTTPSDAGSPWFAAAAAAAGVAAVGAGAVALRGWNDTPDDDGPDDGQPDPELDALDDNALAAREAAIELDARKLLAGGGAPDAARLDKLRHMRRRLRRARRRLRMQGGGRGAGRFGRHAR